MKIGLDRGNTISAFGQLTFHILLLLKMSDSEFVLQSAFDGWYGRPSPLLFRRDESLGRCLMAATKLAKESLNQAVPAAGDHVDGGGGDPAEVVCLMEQDEHCRKFLDRYSTTFWFSSFSSPNYIEQTPFGCPQIALQRAFFLNTNCAEERGECLSELEF